MWLETTVEDPGCGQARTALSAGANVVVVYGGDGTVRHVAEVLAGSGIAMGLLPTGTGNLLARNLRMVIGDLTRATRIALCGDNRAIDVDRVLIDNAMRNTYSWSWQGWASTQQLWLAPRTT